MAKEFACKDAGVKNCSFIARGNTVEEVLRLGAEHGKSVHGYTDKDMTPEMLEKIKRLIKDT